MLERRVDLGGVSLDVLDPSDVVSRISSLIRCGEGGHVVTANVDHLVRLQDDEEFRAAYSAASIRLIDGAPLVWLGWLSGLGRLDRVTGSDLLPRLCVHAAQEGWSVLIAGGPPGAARLAADRLRRRTGQRLDIDTYDVGFIDDRSEGPAARLTAVEIQRRSPDLVFMGLGAPKQELWAWRHSKLLGPTVVISCGAAVEFAAGTTRRAPRIMRTMGFEWLFRLVLEPRRLWRRYLVRDVRFLRIAAEEVWRSRSRRTRSRG